MYFDNYRSNTTLWENGLLYLIDNNNFFITAGNPDEPTSDSLTDANDNAIWQKITEHLSCTNHSNTSGQFYFNVSGNEYAIYYAPVHYTDWMIFITIDLSSYQKMKTAYRILLGTTVLWTSVVLLLVHYLITKKITKPVHLISGTLENVQLQKNYALRIPYDKNDELGNLSDKINALLAYAEANEVHQQEYQRYLTKKTQLDPMTQLFNKNAIENKIHAMIEQANDTHTRIAVGFLDIDNFRDYNTLYGHQEGDRVIRFVASILKENINGIVGDIPSLKNINNLKNISCITSVSSIDEIWLGSEYYSEICRLKKNKDRIEFLGTLKLSDFVENPGFPRFFYEDSKHNLWVVTTKKILVKPADEKQLQDTNFPLMDITGIKEGKDGTLWISTRKQGVYNVIVSPGLTFEEKKIRNLTAQTDGLINDNIGAICVDDSGLVWMGSQEGDVFTYDPQTKKVENLSNMFDMLEEGIYNIIMDQLGHIWISTNKRVVEYDPKNGGIMDYSTMGDVTVNSFMPNSYFKSSSGKILYVKNNLMPVKNFLGVSKIFGNAPESKAIYIQLYIK